MRPSVLLHAARIVKTLLTNRTVVRRLARVRPHVHRQRSVQRKTLPANRTLVRLLARVRPRVVNQVVPLRELFPALVAAERLRPRVDQRVCFQRPDLGEGLFTNFAFVRFDAGVDFRVGEQAAICREIPPADCAEVFLFAMAQLVLLQRRFRREHPVAGRAGERGRFRGSTWGENDRFLFLKYETRRLYLLSFRAVSCAN